MEITLYDDMHEHVLEKEHCSVNWETKVVSGRVLYCSSRWSDMKENIIRLGEECGNFYSQHTHQNLHQLSLATW